MAAAGWGACDGLRSCQSGHVFSDHIELEVYDAARVYGLDIRVVEGIGDDGDIEPGLLHIEDGEADAIEANGAFFDDELGEFLGEFETEFPAAVEVFAVEAGGGRIDMSLDDVSIEAAVHDQASFEVDEIAWLPLAEVGLFEGFFDGGDAVEVVLLFFYREADAVMGNALVDFEFVGNGGCDPECLVGAFAFDSVDPA